MKTPAERFDQNQRRMTRCQSDDDGHCESETCPQLMDGEPARSGRHCPLDRDPAPPPPAFDPHDCGGVWDGFSVQSDADPGL